MSIDPNAPKVPLPRDWKPSTGWQRFFKKPEPPQQIIWVTRTLGCMIFTFRDGVTRDQRIKIEGFLRRSNYDDYIRDVTWSKDGELTVNLHPPRRFIGDCNVRKNARYDMPTIVKDAYQYALGQ